MAVTINGSTGVQLDDNDKQQFGTDDDLDISFNGTNGWIDCNQGSLYIDTTANIVVRVNNNEDAIKAIANGAVELYYDGVKKFETNQYGNKSFQHLYMDDDHKLQLGSSQDLQIYHDGSHSYIKDTGTGVLIIESNQLQIKNDAADEKMIVGDANGSVELYYDGTKQLSTGANGVFTEGSVAFRVGSSGPVSSELFTVQKNNGQVAYFDMSSGHDHNCVAIRHRGATSSTYRTQIAFLNDSGSEIGSVKSHGSSTQFNTSSDYRLKENAVSISDGITRLKTLKPYRFNFKADPDTTVDGFFAHEVTAVPEAVTGEKDKVITQAQVDDGTRVKDDLGNPEYQQIDQSKLVPLLTAALQEAITKIETLETEKTKLQTDLTALTARVAALEAHTHE